MGYKEKILEILQKEDLTVDQLSERIQIIDDPKDNKNNIRSYIVRLLKDEKIKAIGDNLRNKVYRAITSNSILLLKGLYEILLSDKVKVIDRLTSEEKELIKKIEEMIEIE